MAMTSSTAGNSTSWLRNARVIASFALLGAVVVGAFSGQAELGSVDLRVFGAAAGAVAAALKLSHVI